MDTSLWMSRDLLTVDPATPLVAAARRMAQRRVRHVLVVDPPGSTHLVGIVSSHDLYLAAESGVNPFSPLAVEDERCPVGAVMTPHPLSIPSSTSIADAARILHAKKYGCLPVVDHGELVGVLTEHDLLRAFVRMTGADQPGYEVTCVLTATDDVLGRLHELAVQHGLQLVSASMFDHDGRRFGVVHLVGPRSSAFVDGLWRSGHTILRVRATEASAPAAIPVGPPTG
ncbi:MAG: CBS domain-containing protein [Planctomycetes bacterium]|nr:CBS domain-containing protein [Planctomycetota bacterium]